MFLTGERLAYYIRGIGKLEMYVWQMCKGNVSSFYDI